MTARPLAITLVIEEKLETLTPQVAQLKSYESAACRFTDTEMFFSEDQLVAAHAKNICFRCPIQQQCLKDAIQGQEAGIWGGTTETERQEIIELENSYILPSVQEVSAELKLILNLPTEHVSKKYRVEPRTVHRWRKTIRLSKTALRLLDATR